MLFVFFYSLHSFIVFLYECWKSQGAVSGKPASNTINGISTTHVIITKLFTTNRERDSGMPPIGPLVTSYTLTMPAYIHSRSERRLYDVCPSTIRTSTAPLPHLDVIACDKHVVDTPLSGLEWQSSTEEHHIHTYTTLRSYSHESTDKTIPLLVAHFAIRNW